MSKQKNKLPISFENNKVLVSDEKDSVLLFQKPVVITDTSEQWNGTRYDIKTLNIEPYRGTVTTDHTDLIEKVVANVVGLEKKGSKVTIEGLDFAKNESSHALLTYNLVKGGYAKEFSIETIGDFPDEEGVFKNHDLVGLSIVVAGNNRNANINQVIMNSIKESREAGLDTGDIEELLEEVKVKETKKENNDMSFVTIKNTREFEVEIKYKNAAGDECMKVLQAAESVDVSEDQKEMVEKQISEAEAPQAEKQDNDLDKVLAELQEVKKQIANSGIKEPGYKKDAPKAKSAKNALDSMDYQDRMGVQINAAWDYLKGGSSEARDRLMEINELHLEHYKKEGLVKNSMTIADFDNFVLPMEMLTEIEGCRSDFSPLLDKVTYRETRSTQFGWLTRDGDINMQSVEFCDDGENGNLKPISEYEANISTASLEELAAVTPVCNAATRFLAVDMLADIAAGYRNDYDRKLAQLFVARLQQAVDTTGNEVTYQVSASDPAIALEQWITTWAEVTECAANGFFVFSHKTKAELIRRLLRAGINGGNTGIFTDGVLEGILGRPFVTVPDELMPALGTSQTRTFVIGGVSVVIDNAVFYVDPSTWTGRVSGGLQYSVSTEAAYETQGGVRSAYQRNELVLRGSMFRGGQVRNAEKVSGLKTVAVS